MLISKKRRSLFQFFSPKDALLIFRQLHKRGEKYLRVKTKSCVQVGPTLALLSVKYQPPDSVTQHLDYLAYRFLK